MKSGINKQKVALMMNYNNLGDPLTFPLAPLWGETFFCPNNKITEKLTQFLSASAIFYVLC